MTTFIKAEIKKYIGTFEGVSDKILQNIIYIRAKFNYYIIEKENTWYGHTYVFRLENRVASLIALNLIFLRINNHGDRAIM